MKTALLLMFTCLLSTIAWSQTASASLDPNEIKTDTEKSSSKDLDEKAIYFEATKMAKKQILDFVSEKVQYPEDFKGQYLEGTITIDFWVDQRGIIIQTKVMKGINNAFDRAVLDQMKELAEIRLMSIEYFGANRIRIPIDFSMY